MKKLKIYIAGQMTGIEDFNYRKFNRTEKWLRELGYIVLNPACLPQDLDYEDYLPINFAMIDSCDAIYMLDSWEYSPGAKQEFERAKDGGKVIIYETVDPDALGDILDEADEIQSYTEHLLNLHAIAFDHTSVTITEGDLRYYSIVVFYKWKSGNGVVTTKNLLALGVILMDPYSMVEIVVAVDKEIQKYKNAKEYRAKYRKLLSEVKKQIKFLRSALRGKKSV